VAEVIDIAVRADIEQLKAQLKSIPGVSDAAAKEMAQNISKQLNKATAATEKAAAKANKAWGGVEKSSKGASRGIASIAQQMPDVVSQLSSGTNAAQVFTQQGLQVVQVHMNDVLKLLTQHGAKMGLLGAALTAGGVAYAAFSHQLDAANAKIKLQRERLDEVVNVHQRVKAAVVAAGVLQGTISADAANAYTAQAEAARTVGPALEEARQRVQELSSSLQEAESDLDGATQATGRMTGVVAVDMLLAQTRTEHFTDAAQGLRKELATAENDVRLLTAAQINLRDALEATGKSATESGKKLAESEHVDTNLMLAAIVDRRQAEAAAAAEREAEIQARVDAEIAATEQARDAWQKAHDAEMASIAAEKAARQDYALTLASSQAGAVASIASEYERLYGLYKTAAITQITIDAAVAAMKAYATLGPIGGPIAAAAIGGIAAIQAGVVASQDTPQFHVGGLIGAGGNAPDEVGITARRGEGVLTRQGVEAIGGTVALDAANRGTGTPETIRIDHVYKARSFGVVFSDSYGMAGSPVRQAIRTAKGRRVGHRDA